MSHAEYANAARRLLDEEMLLNLVRLRYRESPVWLDVTSISAQFEFDVSGDVTGVINENVGQGGALNPNSMGVGGRLSYYERPTITYSIVRGQDFIKRLLQPFSVEAISLLAEAGWRGNRVFRMTVEGMNGLRNAPRASGPTPDRTPRYERFLEAVNLIQRLADQHLIEFEIDTRVENFGDPIPVKSVEGDMLVDAAKINAEFKLVGDGSSMALVQEQRVLMIRFAPDAKHSAEAIRLRELLSLDKTRVRFDVVDPAQADYDAINRTANLSNISINARSLIGLMYYLSNAIDVPPEDVASGPVTLTMEEDGQPFNWQVLLGDIFTVRYCKNKPGKAAVAVPFRGHWFYIANDDESSLSTFALLNQLAALKAGTEQGPAPVLTIPVGG
ncbi:MAG: hypothetical protein ACYTHJ_03645 [Planctomycetota bacterium]